MTRTNSITRAAVLAAAFCFGASAEELEKDQREVVGFAGSYSKDGDATFGAGIQRALGRRDLLSLELGLATRINPSTSEGRVVSQYVTADANVHVLRPLKSKKKFTPYALVGLGIWGGATACTVGGIRRQTSGGFIAYNLGGGARIQAGKDWGLRPEVKFSLFYDTRTVRITLGIYRRTRP